MGLGLRFKASRYLDIMIEGGRRLVFSDYLDDVSTVYPSESDLTKADRIGSTDLALVFFDRSNEGGFAERRPNSTRGNPNKNDAYYVFQVRLEAYLPKGLLKSKRRKSRPRFR